MNKWIKKIKASKIRSLHEKNFCILLFPSRMNHLRKNTSTFWRVIHRHYSIGRWKVYLRINMRLEEFPLRHKRRNESIIHLVPWQADSQFLSCLSPRHNQILHCAATNERIYLVSTQSSRSVRMSRCLYPSINQCTWWRVHVQSVRGHQEKLSLVASKVLCRDCQQTVTGNTWARLRIMRTYSSSSLKSVVDAFTHLRTDPIYAYVSGQGATISVSIQSNWKESALRCWLSLLDSYYSVRTLQSRWWRNHWIFVQAAEVDESFAWFLWQ